MIETLLKNTKLEIIEDGILTCLNPDERRSAYDGKVRAYDLIVGNALYNRIVWGNWPGHYEAFCRQALALKPDGVFLDAGCGSLVFTAKAYARAPHKLIVLLDRSMGMLKQGRLRIQKLCGEVPKNMVFIQGNIFSLPFKDGVFDTVASFGVLHLFEEKIKLLAELERVRNHAGAVFLSSLVANNTLGKKYLEILRKAGEVANGETSLSLAKLLDSSPFTYRIHSIGNMAYVKSV